MPHLPQGSRPRLAGVPFCSDRCRTIDLGKWASGDYKISSPILDPDLLEDLEHAQQQQHPTGNPKEWKN
jgi:endogenous inhibitor of DNA gyrase (YacG/DUF329 family)